MNPLARNWWWKRKTRTRLQTQAYDVAAIQQRTGGPADSQLLEQADQRIEFGILF